MAQLEQLDPNAVLADIVRIADGKVPALLCFERPPPNPEWCHRGLVSAWFSDKLGLRLVEFRREYAGWGWAHPKLPAGWKLADINRHEAQRRTFSFFDEFKVSKVEILAHELGGFTSPAGLCRLIA